MNAKLFLVYLKLKSCIPALAIFTIVITALNQYQNYKSRVVRKPWIVQEVLSGDQLIVSNQVQTQMITLCGIVSNDSNYLQSLIDKGDNSIELSKGHDGYEAWVMLAPDFEQQIHLNTEMVMAKKATLNNHGHCLSAENLELASSYEGSF